MKILKFNSDIINDSENPNIKLKVKRKKKKSKDKSEKKNDEIQQNNDINELKEIV